jgi:hypothetical protein
MNLDTLIEEVTAEALTDEPLHLLAAAVSRRDDLNTQADELLDHFVHVARDHDCSWAQIGEILGVSKQAAQQRHTGALSRLFGGSARGRRLRPFQRFTDRARNTVKETQVQARALNHNYIGTEHLLLGLFADDKSVAAKVLNELSVTRADVVGEIEERIGRGNQPAKRGHIPFTPRAKQALEQSLQQATDMNHNYIGTEHILLGLISVTDGVAAEILTDRGITRANARSAINKALRDG